MIAPWSADEKATLKRMVAAGEPYAAIRAVINAGRHESQHVTKNSIIGMVNRLCKDRPRFPRPDLKRDAARAAQLAQIAASLTKPKPAPEPDRIVEPPPPARPADGAALAKAFTMDGPWPRGCRYPLFSDIATARGRLFCGKPVEGIASYCEGCRKITYKSAKQILAEQKAAAAARKQMTMRGQRFTVGLVE